MPVGPVLFIGFHALHSPAPPDVAGVDPNPDTPYISATFDGTFVFNGDDVARGAQTWVAGTWTPGDLRLSAGPTYGVVAAQGRGLAPWAAPADEIALPYGGTATMAGLRGSAAYAFTHLDGLDLVGEIGAAYSTDGARGYTTGTMRVGVVPRGRGRVAQNRWLDERS